MSALSKYFEQAIADATCRDILHPGIGCEQFAWSNLLGTVRSNVHFFLPISLLRLVLLVYNRRAVSSEILRQTSREFGAMMVNALCVANCWTGMFCLMMRTTGRIHDNFSVSLAPLLGSCAMFLMPAYVQTTHAKAIVVANLECWIKSREGKLVEWMRDSRTVGTLCFMLISAGIARYARKTRHRTEFWFIQPLKRNYNQLRREKLDKAACEHGCYHQESTCARYVLNGMRTYFTFGAILELARRLIVTIGQLHQTPSERIRSLLNLRYRLILFLTLYNGTFRLVTCLLGQRRRQVKEYDNTIAGFASGFWYYVCPSYNIFNLAVCALTQTHWNFLMEKYAKIGLVQRLDRVSFSSLVWIISMCYVTYSRAYYPWAMSKFALKFIDICSNYASRTASENFAARYFAAQ
ncbi:uncharacterized protein LOC126558184 [Anopheles maculipalpis]|uniref:uncharacterized protein LOC126558184 n=1 Tax=Anopheles maculipalpis TaxID=1496333 RepID=UPI00215959FA|nr:uncharacterized protein LOC126558184 [Anopheles maculipalpis]